MGEQIAVGDRIEWCGDIDGRPVEPGDPRQGRTPASSTACTGILATPTGLIVAYLVRCRGGVSGTHLATVLPEHRPAVVDS